MNQKERELISLSRKVYVAAAIAVAAFIVNTVVNCQKVQTTGCAAIELAHAACHTIPIVVAKEETTAAPPAPASVASSAPAADGGTETVLVPKAELEAFVRSVRRRQLQRPSDAGAD